MRYSVIHREAPGRTRKRRFSDKAYEDACKLIEGVTQGQAEKKKVHVKVSKGDSTISSLITEVLTQNGLKPKDVSQTNKKINYTFDSKEKANKALTLISWMKGDTLSNDSYNYNGRGDKYVRSNAGIEMEVTDIVNASKHVDAGTGIVTYTHTSTTNSDTPTAAAGSNKTKIIIIAAVAVLAIAVTVVIIKKKKK